MEVIDIKKFNIALYEPVIPQHTGHIDILCACTGADLFLIGKLGFSLSDKYTKRAGLDYWDSVNIKKYDKLDDLKNEYKDSNFYYFTTKSKISYFDVKYQEGDFLVFGPETRGIPEEILFADGAKSVTIPMKDEQRSLNLSNSVSIALYEAIRQCS